MDASQARGEIRALNGGNCGPIQFGGLLDLTAQLRDLKMPYARLHDCHWPNPDVVDIHTIFANFDADPERIESYDFRRTDDYLQSVAETGSQVIYRLGESIEHSQHKYFVHPPKDFEKWAAVCVGIIRHCNESWGGGPPRNIKYWEIWNEPENRPAMWSGSDEDYLRLYETTARVIKKRFPAVKVGGPALGYTGSVTDGKFTPGEFLLKFLDRCKERELPLDFLSWHLYTNNPAECLVRARGIRAVLDERGFAKTELHFNEWNYLPGNDWTALSLKGQGLPRERFFAELGSAKSAAFAACVLMNLQDSPVDVANYYASDNIGFGLFTPDGVPRKTYFAFRAFSLLLETPLRIESTGSRAEDCAICAGTDQNKSEVRILISNYRESALPGTLALRNLPWKETSNYELYKVDEKQDLNLLRKGNLEGGKIELAQDMKAPAILLFEIRRSVPSSK